MMTRIRMAAGAFIASAALLTAVPAASAQVAIQDGLVNVTVGDVTILEDVRVAVAAQVAATICDVQVGPVVLLGQAVDASGRRETICRTDQGPVRIVQN